MRSISLLCALLVTVNVAFAQTPPPRPLSLFEQELINNEKQFLDAFQNKNVAYVAEAVGEDFRGIVKNGDFQEKSELVADAAQGLPKDFRIYDIQVLRLDEACAVVTYNSIFPGSLPRYGHMSDTWTKQDGKWKLRFQQITPNRWSALDLD